MRGLEERVRPDAAPRQERRRGAGPDLADDHLRHRHARSSSAATAAGSTCSSSAAATPAATSSSGTTRRRTLYAGDLVEAKAALYTGDAYHFDWATGTLDAVKAYRSENLIGGRGAVARGVAETDAAIEQTREVPERHDRERRPRPPRQAARSRRPSRRPTPPWPRSSAPGRSSSIACPSTCSGSGTSSTASTIRGSGRPSATARSGRSCRTEGGRNGERPGIPVYKEIGATPAPATADRHRPRRHRRRRPGRPRDGARPRPPRPRGHGAEPPRLHRPRLEGDLLLEALARHPRPPRRRRPGRRARASSGTSARSSGARATSPSTSSTCCR